MKLKSSVDTALLSEEDLKRQSPLERDFKSFKNFDDPRFGDINVLQNPRTREIIFAKERKANDIPELERWVRAAKSKISSQTSKYILKMLDYSVTKRSELCSSFYIFRAYYEYPKNDLKKELAELLKTGKGLNNSQITHLLYQLLTAQMDYQKKGIIHGDLQPIYIAWDAKKQEAKIIENAVEDVDWVKQIQIQKNRVVAKQPLYQSDLMHTSIKQGKLKFTYDPKKEEAFALGLIILEAGLGKSIQGIYPQDSDRLSRERLGELQGQFSKLFEADNTLLVSSVNSLLILDEEERPTADVILESVPAYEDVASFLKMIDEGKITPEQLREMNSQQSTGNERKLSSNAIDGEDLAQDADPTPAQPELSRAINDIEEMVREHAEKEQKNNMLEKYQQRAAAPVQSQFQGQNWQSQRSQPQFKVFGSQQVIQADNYSTNNHLNQEQHYVANTAQTQQYQAPFSSPSFSSQGLPSPIKAKPQSNQYVVQNQPKTGNEDDFFSVPDDILEHYKTHIVAANPRLQMPLPQSFQSQQANSSNQQFQHKPKNFSEHVNVYAHNSDPFFDNSHAAAMRPPAIPQPPPIYTAVPQEAQIILKPSQSNFSYMLQPQPVVLAQHGQQVVFLNQAQGQQPMYHQNVKQQPNFQNNQIIYRN